MPSIGAGCSVACLDMAWFICVLGHVCEPSNNGQANLDAIWWGKGQTHMDQRDHVLHGSIYDMGAIWHI